MQYQLHHGDCLAVLAEMPDSSVDSIVTDPPYELGFMGKSWDASGIAYNVDMWREALRVLKPGGHLLAFSGSRTYHRMTCAIEDAGFEIRDQIMWVYGSGFPKSLDVSKAIDKAAGAEREVVGQGHRKNDRDATSIKLGRVSDDFDITAPATDAARQWEGWGTALKPAHEPICVARKPLVGTVAANVLEFGTGALNIDGCRVAAVDKAKFPEGYSKGTGAAYAQDEYSKTWLAGADKNPGARWPANLIHDGSDEVLAAFPDAKGQQGATAARKQGDVYGAVNAGQIGVEPRNDTGSAARFFYCAKASKSDRNSGLDSHVNVDIQWSFIEFGKLTWEVEAQKVRLLVDTGQSRPRVTGVYGAPNKSATEWNTMLFGSESTDRSRTDTMSITGMKTSCITVSKILSCFQSFATNGSTPGVNSATASGGNHAENAGTGALRMTTTNEWMASALGAAPAASPMRLKISVSAAQSGHPTVKPTDLMAYLCRLVTPRGGVVLDPFMGSGSTGKAAMREGFWFIGIDMTAEYVEIARARIEHALFGDLL